MGNTKGNQRKQFQVKIDHPRFHQSKIITHQDSKYLETTFTINEKQYQKWKLIVNKVASPPHNLLLPIKHSFSRTAMCGHTGNAVVDYQNYPYLLTEEIYSRGGKKTRFSEVQIWFLLYSLIRANGQACQLNQQLVDLRPTNIFLNEDGHIKMSTNLSWPLQVSNLQKAMDKQRTYLAPQDVQLISRGQLLQTPNQIALAFAIGLTALSVGNLHNYEDLYDMNNSKFDYKRFDESLFHWRNNSSYSEVLRGTVSLLCCPDPSRRLTVSELNDLLLKHHQNIEAKTNFMVDNAPPKLHEEIMGNRRFMGPPVQMVNPQSPPVPFPPHFQMAKVVNQQPRFHIVPSSPPPPQERLIVKQNNSPQKGQSPINGEKNE